MSGVSTARSGGAAAEPLSGRGAAPRVLIVAEHASARFGGEAVLPLHYFRLLRRRGVEAWLVVHSRTRDELMELLPHERDRMVFMPDTFLHKALHRVGKALPGRFSHFLLGFPMQMLTQVHAKKTVRDLIRRHGADIVHQPIPVSPRFPSAMHGFGVPVVIGPMNGGMNYPPGYEYLEGRGSAAAMRFGRAAANVINRLIPGKRRARILLVANARTRSCLPAGGRATVVELVENAVDLDAWRPGNVAPRGPAGTTRFAFLGRFVDWKCIDILLHAFKPLADKGAATLTLIGDGGERPALEALVDRLEMRPRVTFTGFLPQKACAAALGKVDVLVLPSVLECGGAVVLEAMAMGLPVIAADWGGPADYLTPDCGISVPPAPRETYAARLEHAMWTLANDASLRKKMGAAGRARVQTEFNWDRKIDRILEIYREAMAAG